MLVNFNKKSYSKIRKHSSREQMSQTWELTLWPWVGNWLIFAFATEFTEKVSPLSVIYVNKDLNKWKNTLHYYYRYEQTELRMQFTQSNDNG